jgi:Tol biopolymer transport system component
MALIAGSRLGPYELVSLVGSGGMGEVYRARDTRLGRTVAIKILPSPEPGLRERFEREAKAVSALNHPGICTLYDVGREGDLDYLVMEFCEGETLQARLERGALKVEDAMSIAIEVADAIDKAHRAGIVHRDLKPGNIVIVKSGAAEKGVPLTKLLDFGLAKTVAPVIGLVHSGAPTTPNLTAEGTILGTVQYMAPEQLEGHEADFRSDIFAFGAVTYEMLTGRRAFEGKGPASVISGILERHPPPISTAQPSVPPALERAVMKCLAKVPDSRWQTASDLADELRWIAAGGTPEGVPAGVDRPPRRQRLPWITAGVSVVALAAALVIAGREAVDRRPDTAAVRASIILPRGLQLPPGMPFARFALSPDGHRIAFVAAKGTTSTTTLWVHSLDSGVTQPLSDTDGATFPFWSPDSRFIGFQAEGKLKKIDSSGGQPVTLCDAWSRATGTWNQDDVILFTPNGGSPIHRVSASGGTPSPVTALDPTQGDAQHWFPSFLPDGRHFLYYAVGSTTGGVTDPRAVYLGSLDRSEPDRLLLEGGSNARYASGHLLFMRDRTLMAQPFDAARLELSGQAVPVAEELQMSNASDFGIAAAFTVSETGVLAYQSGVSAVTSRLVWFDRTGDQIAALGDPADYGDVALSPDGSRAAVSVLDPARGIRDLWLVDVRRGVRTRATFDQADAIAPIWSPDDRRLVFGSGRQGGFDMYRMSSGGSGTEELLFRDGLGKFPVSWAPDGRHILYVAGAGTISRSDLRILTLADGSPSTGPVESSPFLETPFAESQGQFSPDGRWVAYTSNESGRFEVFVVPFPLREGKWQVSTAGGWRSHWRADGRELFYLKPDNTLMAVAVDGHGARFELGAEQPLFVVQPPPQVRLDASVYAVSPDGRRFLVNTLVEDPTPAVIALVLNWRGVGRE